MEKILPPYLTLPEAAGLLGITGIEDTFLRMAEQGEISLYWKLPAMLNVYNLQISGKNRTITDTERAYRAGDLLPISKAQAMQLLDSGTVSINHDSAYWATENCLIFGLFETCTLDESSEYNFLNEDYLKPEDIFIRREDFSALHDGKKISAEKNPQTELVAKTRNSYLRVIEALSLALIKGTTGKPHTDAEAVLAALATAGIDAPIKKDALANYLKEAKGLDI